MNPRAWSIRLCLCLLLLTPLAVYWPTIFHTYGLRDDYSYLREAREEPGKVLRFTSSHGRPIYGLLLERSFALVDRVSRLPWLRMASVLLLTLLAFALAKVLVGAGWTLVEATAIGLGVVLLPAAQVASSWAIGWPYALALLLALGGFWLVERSQESSGRQRWLRYLAGGLAYVVVGLIYQSNALFAVVPVAALLLLRPDRAARETLGWTTRHLVAVVVGLALSLVLAKLLFSGGSVPPTHRMRLEDDPFSKLIWFFTQPLPNAAALFVLRDTYGVGAQVFWSVVAGVGLVAVTGVVVVARAMTTAARWTWLLCLAVLPFVAHAVSLAAFERSMAYRVLFALSGLMLVALVFGLRTLRLSGWLGSKAETAVLGILIVIGAIAARANSFELIAVPQGHEWELVRNSAARLNVSAGAKVYAITPTLADRSTERIYADEFGSLSTDSDWVPKEMFKAALHERFPEKAPQDFRYSFASGRKEPERNTQDVVVDLRELKRWRGP
jgi:hypothetical protein